jgi:hypothetical protein
MRASPGAYQMMVRERQAGGETMTHEPIIRTSFSAWEHNDWETIESLLADGFTFRSPDDDQIDKHAYKKKCWPGVEIIDTYDLVTIIEHGDEAFVRYPAHWHNGASFRVTEYMKFQDGKIKEIDGYWGFLPRNVEGMERFR